MVSRPDRDPGIAYYFSDWGLVEYRKSVSVGPKG
jgi:hypothetical protein